MVSPEEEILKWFAGVRHAMLDHVLQCDWKGDEPIVMMGFILPSAIPSGECGPIADDPPPTFNVYYDRAMMRFTHAMFQGRRIELPE